MDLCRCERVNVVTFSCFFLWMELGMNLISTIYKAKNIGDRWKGIDAKRRLMVLTDTICVLRNVVLQIIDPNHTVNIRALLLSRQ
jgi:hypothetical protein